MTWRYVKLLTNDLMDAHRRKSSIERIYAFLEPQAAQEAKIKLYSGFFGMITEKKPQELKVTKGNVIAEPPLIGYSEVQMQMKTEGQDYTLTFGSKRQKINKLEGSVMRLSIISDDFLFNTQIGKVLPSYVRQFEDGLLHYRHEELSTLAKALGGGIDPVFGLQRDFNISAEQALIELDRGISLEELAKRLLEQRKEKIKG